MVETLYIRLGSQAQDAIHWLIYSNSENEIIASGKISNAGELIQLTEKAKNRQVTIFVPGCDVVLKSLTVPSKSTKAMQLAVPYMLEDDLAQDVDKLFFAYTTLSNKQHLASSHNCFVAAVDLKIMKQWLQWLEDADIKFKVMMPDFLAMPLAEQGFTVALLEEQVIVRQGPWQGFTVDLAAWKVISQQWLVKHTNLESKKGSDDRALLLNTYSSLPEMSNEFPVNNLPEELPLALLAQQAQYQPFNLLQGKFQLKEKRSPAMINWLWAAGFAIFALLLNVGIKGGQLIHLTSAQQAVEDEIIKTYQKSFPESKKIRVNTIKSQLTRKLAAAGDGSSQNGFLAMLTKIRPAFAQVPELKPESLKFDGKRQEIRIQAVANDYIFFDKFKTELEKTSVKITLGSQSNQGEEISGSISISSTDNESNKGAKS